MEKNKKYLLQSIFTTYAPSKFETMHPETNSSEQHSAISAQARVCSSFARAAIIFLSLLLEIQPMLIKGVPKEI